jgi:endonuclease/exonuclease/phosphatase family metal-dependent hydrolase
LIGVRLVSRALPALLVALSCAGGCRERPANARPAAPKGSAPSGASTETPAHVSSRPVAPASAAAADVVPGTVVRLVARHASGVPLHPARESPDVSGRLPDGTEARVISVEAGGRWLQIEAGDVRGYVTRRYLAKAARTGRPVLAPSSPWSYRDAFLTALRARTSQRTPGSARVGAWNLRWFPDGQPGSAAPATGTDLEWLACAIAWLDVDVLALSEIKHGARAELALSTLRQHLERLTGAPYRSVLDDCPRGASQHVGFLFRPARARLGRLTTLGELNPHATPCKDQLRPGLAGYFRFPGGLDLTLVAVHLKSGPDARDLTLRDRSFAAFATAREASARVAADRDVLVLGDMNTMGCESCSPAVTPSAELARVDALLARGAWPFRRVPSDVPCSHFYGGKATLLDWAAASDLGELPAARTARVGGLCAELGCVTVPAELGARKRLSDHCPLVVELDDHDDDPDAPTRAP